MELSLQITFRDIPPSKAIEAKIRQQAEKLNRFYQRIISCRVTIEVPHQHQRQGKIYHVRIDLTVPQGELVINRHPSQHQSHENLYVAIAIPSPNQIHKKWQLVKRAFVGQLVLLLIQYPQSPCLKFYHCCTACLLTSARQPWVNWVSLLLLC